MSTPRRSWVSLAALLGAGALTAALLDAAFHRVAAPHRIREVEDGVRELENEDPDTLFLGSSHGRTFDFVGDAIERRSGGRRQLVAVAVERGKLSSYRWVLEHRLLPLLEERRNMRHFVLVTEWWDSLAEETGGPAANLPGRAWVLGDYAADVLANGVTSYNRNYLQQRWRRLWSFSSLVQDRGHGNILRNLGRAVRPQPAEQARALYEQDLVGWRDQVESGHDLLFDPGQMAALDAMLALAKERGWRTTVILYPRMPSTLTDLGKRTTLARFRARMDEITAEAGVRLIDMTTDSPLTDDDFARDFDHVTETGNRKFTEWSLAGPLSFMLDDAEGGP